VRLTLLAFLATVICAHAADRFTGMVSCASSGCHGGGKGSDQCIIWRKGDPATGLKDPHRGAANILSAARSAAIASALGIADATKSQQCTVCHSPMQSVPDKALLTDVKRDTGVSCESCHGAAEKWIRSHVRPDFTHQQRVALGLRDLETPYQRANSCAGCHTNISPELIKAKHPELKFELARQINSLPKHWQERTEASSATYWLAGQAVVLREWSWQLAGKRDVSLLTRWRAMQWLLKKTKTGDRILPALSDAATPDDFERVKQAADRLAMAASKENLDSAQQFQELIALKADFSGKLVEDAELARRAELLVFALRANAPIDKDGKLSPAIQAGLDALSALLKPGVPFDPGAFAQKLEALRVQ